ncbi:FAD-dependent oxidoreductase [Sinanaerobacter chloroacetimidivorans]|uniref:FAD-dependent oxidoreductase n=1 Tax=Sinanaerobacter chloroacetimidivorans TaxID=2818044 RepID=A0A8J7W496_9FIRM|nr:FAD-dependent oxidoreductase [Sinanaerobacter chloroacetimidivorans]MBR0599068.1 FAD-dependent oxidoreductase [Sinanaerobacter chloroacetimidivorans]
MSKKVLIIGGVAGGASTAARLRRLDETLEIIIFERGEYISYANCGLPYYIGDVIKERDALLLQTPEAMMAKFNIDVRVNHEVLSIQREVKEVTVKNGKTGEEYREAYDTLLIATGSSPIKPPIPGIDGPGIYTLWTVPDTDRIKQFVREQKPKKAAIIGGGFIGLEMAENLHAAGCQVTVIEMQNQVMAPMDYEMAQLVHENMRMNHVRLELGDGVKEFRQKEGATTILLQSGKTVEADIVILSIGIKPNSELARKSGLTLNAKGGIVVDEFLKTSDPSIYAVGDVIEVEEYVSKNRTMIPLAGPANKQARICADNIAKEYGLLAGKPEKYNGTQGTSIAQVFDLTAAATGVNEKTLTSWGKELNRDYYIAIINQKSHAGYYPGATPLTLKLIFNQEGKIFGAQIVGQDGVDKRIDTIATTLRLGGTVHDLAELELAYAPPYSSAKDPVNMLGFVAENILSGLVSIVGWNELENLAQSGSEDYIILDVGEDLERMAFSIPNSCHIPLGQLRKRYQELDKEKLIIPYCAIGVRAYNAARILMNLGFKNVKIFPGGTTFYKSVFHDPAMGQRSSEGGETMEHTTQPIKTQEIDMGKIVAKQTLDCSGLQCPGPIMRVFQTIKEMEEGEILQVSATDMGFVRDIEAWCKRMGNTLLKSERVGKENIVYIRKGLATGNGLPQEAKGADSIPAALPQGKTLIVFSGDLDKVLASFIIANGAAAMGRPVTMFFTFWGLNALRKREKQSIKKPLMDSMFGAMMPRGTSKLTLSKMHMGGMGTQMMKKVMKDKNIDSLEDLMRQAMFNGVKLVACTMSMDVMGITKEELIDGIEYAGVAAYLGDAEESNVNLFI